MSAIPVIVPVSDLRRAASELLNAVSGTSEPIVITQRGHAKAVLQDIEAYRYTQQKLEIAELLATGEMDIKAGHHIPSDEVIARAYGLADEFEAAAE